MNIDYRDFIKTINSCLKNFKPKLNIDLDPKSIFHIDRLLLMRLTGGSSQGESEPDYLELGKRDFTERKDEIAGFISEKGIHPDDFKTAHKKEFQAFVKRISKHQYNRKYNSQAIPIAKQIAKDLGLVSQKELHKHRQKIINTKIYDIVTSIFRQLLDEQQLTPDKRDINIKNIIKIQYHLLNRYGFKEKPSNIEEMLNIYYVIILENRRNIEKYDNLLDKLYYISDELIEKYIKRIEGIIDNDPEKIDRIHKYQSIVYILTRLNMHRPGTFLNLDIKLRSFLPKMIIKQILMKENMRPKVRELFNLFGAKFRDIIKVIDSTKLVEGEEFNGIKSIIYEIQDMKNIIIKSMESTINVVGRDRSMILSNRIFFCRTLFKIEKIKCQNNGTKEQVASCVQKALDNFDHCIDNRELINSEIRCNQLLTIILNDSIDYYGLINEIDFNRPDNRYEPLLRNSICCTITLIISVLRRKLYYRHVLNNLDKTLLILLYFVIKGLDESKHVYNRIGNYYHDNFYYKSQQDNSEITIHKCILSGISKLFCSKFQQICKSVIYIYYANISYTLNDDSLYAIDKWTRFTERYNNIKKTIDFNYARYLEENNIPIILEIEKNDGEIKLSPPFLIYSNKYDEDGNYILETNYLDNIDKKYLNTLFDAILILIEPDVLDIDESYSYMKKQLSECSLIITLEKTDTNVIIDEKLSKQGIFSDSYHYIYIH